MIEIIGGLIFTALFLIVGALWEIEEVLKEMHEGKVINIDDMGC